MEGLYILHFDRPTSQGWQHYTGLSKSLELRINAHAEGNGSLFSKKMLKAGILFQVGAVFDLPPTRTEEVKLKPRAKFKCLTCNGGKDSPNLRRDWLVVLNDIVGGQ